MVLSVRMKYTVQRVSAGNRGLILVCLLLLGMWMGSIRGLAAEPDQIAFVQLRWVSNTVSVVSMDVVPGRLKPRPIREAGLRLQLVDEQGKVLWEASAADPREIHYEFPDEANGDQLTKIRITDPNAPWTVRVPWTSSAKTLLVYGALSSATPDPADPNGPTNVAPPTRPLLARVRLPDNQGAP